MGYEVYQNLSLKNNANNAKNTVSTKSNMESTSKNIGNLPGNLSAGAFSVFDGDSLFYAGKDGIYKCPISESSEISSENSKKIADGRFSSLNYFNENLYCINMADNCVYKLSDLNNESGNPYIDKIYTSDAGFELKCIGINSDNVYVLSKYADSYVLKSANLRIKNKVNDVWSGSATNAWMYLNDSTLRLCVANSSSWEALKGDIDGNKTSGLIKYCSGAGSPASVAFEEDKIFVLNSSRSQNSSSISVCDSGGGRSDINLNSPAKSMLLSGQTVFVESDNQHFLWFNTDTNMTHDIDGDFKNCEVRAININDGKFCVIYADDTVLFSDIDSLN